MNINIPIFYKPVRQDGFTLLEVLIVIFILGLITAMVVPAAGVLDNSKRTEITRNSMELLRRAIVGPDDRFDAKGHPVVGGYVGDLHAWPGLWEARAEIRPDFAGVGWNDPEHMTAGLGQGPDYVMAANLVFFRPSGAFTAKQWRWNRPYRRLYNDTSSNTDNIGGLETENEGQPRGLWTRYPEDLPLDLPGHPAPGLDLGPNWQGPYVNPPLDAKLSDSGHWAENDGAYAGLEPVWASGHETWEDGDYAPSPSTPGEFFDDKESFRLLQNDGRFVDGWGRSLRFFITADPDAVGETIFWILSEGPDRAGEYPNKGTCANHAWTADANDVMSQSYDPEDDANRDNIILKLYSRDWQALLALQEERRAEETRAQLALIRAALVGDAPTGLNSGYSGDLGIYPALFRWEGDHWDDESDSPVAAYSVGQPRGLWTASPNSSDSGDSLPASQWGLGRRRDYLPVPTGSGEEERLVDAWGRELLFFHDKTNNGLLVLSRGGDGLYDFGDTNGGYAEPANTVEVFDIASYDPVAVQNRDNIVLRISASDWGPAFFRLPQLAVCNAYVGDATYGTTKAAFFRDATLTAGIDLLTATTLVDVDGDTMLDDWVVGDGTPVDSAFNYNDLSSVKAYSGARYLAVWNDANNNGIIDSGENYQAFVYPLSPLAGSGQVASLNVDAAAFSPLP